MPSNSIARHAGFVTEVFPQKNYLYCWSPQVSLEADHTAKFPQPPKHREVDSPMLSPLVGQWIQFDVQSKDLDKYMSTRSGYRLSIQEYLPINSPCGVGVVQCGKIVRVRKIYPKCILIILFFLGHDFMYFGEKHRSSDVVRITNVWTCHR